MAGRLHTGDTFDVVVSIIRDCEDIRKNVGLITVDKPCFQSVATFTGELRVVLADLSSKRELLQGPASSELRRLEAAVGKLRKMLSQISKRSRIFLLLNTAKVVADVQDALQEIGHCLNLVPILALMAAVSSNLHSRLADLRVHMRTATLKPEPGNEEMARAIETGFEEHRDDRLYASSLLTSILKQLDLPTKEAGVLKDEVQEDLALAEKEKREADSHQLWELKRILGRAVVSLDLHGQNADSPLSKRAQLALSQSAPDSFRCSMTGEVMHDPVTLVETNVTYERSSIEDWFSRGRTTCPDTGREVRSQELRPNVTLKHAIEEDFECLNQKTLAVSVACLDAANGLELADALESVHILTAEKKYAQHVMSIGGLPPLVRLLNLESVEDRDVAVGSLTNISRLGETAQTAIMEAGALQPVLKICSDDVTHSSAALQLLQALSESFTVRAGITDEMGVITLIKVLNSHPTGLIGEQAESILEKFWLEDSYVAIQMASAGMFKPLVALLGPDKDMETRLMMADAVMTWGVNMASRVDLVNAGVIPPVLDLLNNGPPEGVAAAARAIEHLSHTEANRVALAKGGVISGLVKARIRGSVEVKEAAAATLLNLAMDDQDLDGLDEEGAALRLTAMLRVRDSSNREYAVRTLETMVRDNKMTRLYVLEDEQAVPAIFEQLQDAGSHFMAGSMRASTVLLLSHLCLEPKAVEVMKTSGTVVKMLASLLDRPIPQEERDAIMVLLATLAANPEMRLVVAGEEKILPALGKGLQGKGRLKEQSMAALASLADPSDLLTQQQVAKLGAVQMAFEYLQSGPDVMRLPSAKLLGNLSQSTPKLLGGSNKGFNMKISFLKDKKTGPEKRRPCRVHAGKCSLEATFCLVEGEVLPVLLELIVRGDKAVAETSMAAVASLLASDEDLDRAADYLVKQDIIQMCSDMVGKSQSATITAVAVLERIFRVKKFRAIKYTQPAAFALGKYVTTANGTARKTAAEALQKLNGWPKAGGVSLTETLK